jgi:hypothetical protein
MLRALEVPMSNTRAWSRADVLATLATGSVLGVVGVSLALADPSGRTERLLESLSNLRAIGAAISEYRADNNGYLPFEMTTLTRRPRPGNNGATSWCTWQFGGKNTDPFWFTSFSARVDVEAADRPLNPYLYPEYPFFAPPAPERLAADDPARARDQARVFRDPADAVGRQESWPNPNASGRSEYDSVGTSYQTNMVWFAQMTARTFVQRYNEGTRRLAADEGVDPDRFVHLIDSLADIIMYNSNPNARFVTNHGTQNESVTLFADAHADLISFIPGNNLNSFTNENYSVWFEELGRPASRTPAPSRPR